MFSIFSYKVIIDVSRKNQVLNLSFKKTFVLCFLFLIFCVPPVQAKLGVLKPKCKNGNCERKWKNFESTLKNAKVDYEILDKNFLNKAKECKFLFIPFLDCISDEVLSELEQFKNNDGKIIITTSDLKIKNERLNKFANLVDIGVLSVNESKKKKRIKIKDVKYSLKKRCKVAELLTSHKSEAVLNWMENQTPAVTLGDSGSYIAWQWGLGANKRLDAKVLRFLLAKIDSEAVLERQITLSKKDFQKNINRINYYKNKISKNFDHRFCPEKQSLLTLIQNKIYLSEVHKQMAINYFNEKNIEKTLTELEISTDNILEAYKNSIVSEPVEARALWVDRGTIVSIHSQQAMSELFEKIKKAGVNIVYFEAVNAGFAVYPSKLIEQTPQAKGIDPLNWAVIEAHKRNIELHPWVWIFAVGNKRHNSIIAMPEEYKGPLLERDPSFSLLGQRGKAVPINQHEFWVDPSNPQSQKHLLLLLKEIATNYDIDGIQLDYIRYPFQNRFNLMGLNSYSIEKFERETGISFGDLTQEEFDCWNQWKADQVTTFVKNASSLIKEIKPEARVSAAVFGGSQQKRLKTIGQEWEKWVESRWVDILNPMIYSKTTEGLERNLVHFKKGVGKKALVYPGVALKHLNDVSLDDQINTVRIEGLSGSTLFAMDQFDKNKIESLSKGIYQVKNASLPGKEPFESSRLLLNRFLKKLDILQSVLDKKEETKQEVFNRIKQESQAIYTDVLMLKQNPNNADIKMILNNIETIKRELESFLNVEFPVNIERKRSLLGDLDKVYYILSVKHYELKSFVN